MFAPHCFTFSESLMMYDEESHFADDEFSGFSEKEIRHGKKIGYNESIHQQFLKRTSGLRQILCITLFKQTTKHYNRPTTTTLQLHYNAVVGVHGKKTRYNGPRYIHATVVQTSFTCFHIRKQMPHPPSFGMGHQSVYLVYSYNTQTFHKSWFK